MLLGLFSGVRWVRADESLLTSSFTVFACVDFCPRIETLMTQAVVVEELQTLSSCHLCESFTREVLDEFTVLRSVCLYVVIGTTNDAGWLLRLSWLLTIVGGSSSFVASIFALSIFILSVLVLPTWIGVKVGLEDCHLLLNLDFLLQKFDQQLPFVLAFSWVVAGVCKPSHESTLSQLVRKMS